MTKKLSELISIKSQYQRSIHLLRDWESKNNIEKYHLTPTGDAIVENLISGFKSLNKLESNRAFSIIGPFGTGKSAFALFLLDLFCSIIPTHLSAQKKREKISFKEKPFYPVLLVGKRITFKRSLLIALKEAMKEISPELCKKIDIYLSEDNIPDLIIVKFFEEANSLVYSNGYEGLFIIIDEFGKFLEYSAQFPDDGDIFVLQDLAEMIERRENKAIIVTILHSSFEGYLPTLDEIRRNEWKKIQGRFKDIPFLEPPEQFIGLIADAIEKSPLITTTYHNRLKEILNSNVFDETFERFPIPTLVENCAPLHPITALMLYPLFRSKLSQNERSLFAFLLDQGLYGFFDFLSRNNLDSENPNLYRLDYLYDYIFYSFGISVLNGDQSHRWVEINHAIERISYDAPDLVSSIIKTIGLINMYGSSVGLNANIETIKIALDNQDGVFDAIAYLENKSIIVHRRYTGAYALWEGSDVNLEKEYANAINKIGFGNLAHRLNLVMPSEPIIAKAHYIKTGTFRYFNLHVVENLNDWENYENQSLLGQGDGHIIYLLPSDTNEKNDQIEKIEAFSNNNKNRNIIVALPSLLYGLEQVLKEYETWLFVWENVTALANDPVARKEVTLRVENAQRQVYEIVGNTFGLKGYPFNPKVTRWFHNGEEKNIASVIEFQQWISEIFNSVFYSAPELHNELINRDQISSAASNARRKLIQLLVENNHEEKLGITSGTPPELSIYLTLVKKGGFHHAINGVWEITPPNNKWMPVWMKMETFLTSSKQQKRILSDLVDELKAPPFGLREGPIYILITLIILYHKNEIALFEDGYFVSEFLSQVFERITKQPNTFEVQFFTDNMATQKTISEISNILGKEILYVKPNHSERILDIVKPLILFVATLPSYTRKTHQLDYPEAIKIRDVILRTKDPFSLIFKEIPDSIGIREYNNSYISDYMSILSSSIICLKQTYPKLLDDIQAQIKDVFRLDGDYEEIRRILQERSNLIKSFASQGILLTFVQEASRKNDTRDWREVFGRVICNGKPTIDWLDIDKLRYRTNLLNLAGEFLRLEEMVRERGFTTSDVTVFRVGLLGKKFEENRQVVSIKEENYEDVDILSKQIIFLLENISKNQNGNTDQIRIAALAKVANKYLMVKKDGK